MMLQVQKNRKKARHREEKRVRSEEKNAHIGSLRNENPDNEL